MKPIILIISCVAFFVLVIRYMESQSVYYPMKGVTTTPAMIGLPYEDVYFDVADGIRLNGWYVPSKDATFTLMLCHGNAGNISHRLEKIKILHNLGLNIFIFDYRGYGKSAGTPSENGLYADAEAAYKYLINEKKVGGDNIILYGESIGGAVAINLACSAAVMGLITEEAFTSFRDMARIAFPVLPYFIFSSSFDAVSKIKGVRCPKLIIHSVDDEIVPFHLGEKLFDSAAAPKRFVVIKGGHNTTFLESQKKIEESIKDFLNRPKQAATDPRAGRGFEPAYLRLHILYQLRAQMRLLHKLEDKSGGRREGGEYRGPGGHNA